MKTAMTQLVEYIGMNIYPYEKASNEEFVNKVKELLILEKEQLETFYCRSNKCGNNLIKHSAKLFYEKNFKE